MYSLRTDDIPGARPKLRHYEIKIVRHEADNKPMEYVPDFGSRTDQKSMNLKINNPQKPENIMPRSRVSSVPLVLPQQQPKSMKDVDLSQSYVGHQDKIKNSSGLMLPDENRGKQTQQREESKPSQRQVNSPKEQPNQMLTSQQSMQRSTKSKQIIEGSTFNIITNHKIKYKIEPLGYVPSWS